MNGILLINKVKGLTSRDVVNEISKKYHTKKVGHAGTLDPIASGLLIIGINGGTKILELLTLDKKEYVATVKMGIKTDTLDITGNVLLEEEINTIDEKKLEKVLKTFTGSYEQTVPKYSAVKITGKRLYEYARKNEEVTLPKRIVNIYNIELLNVDLENKEFTFKTLVSKGTYIRSLIDDISNKLNICCTMKDLVRTKSGKFKIEDSYLIEEDHNIIDIKDALDFKIIKVNNQDMLKKIKNGNKIDLLNEDSLYITFIDENDQEIAIYQKDEKIEYKAFKVF